MVTRRHGNHRPLWRPDDTPLPRFYQSTIPKGMQAAMAGSALGLPALAAGPPRRWVNTPMRAVGWPVTNTPPLPVLLMSGGVESATLLYTLKHAGGVLPLFLDYGQRARRPEWRAVQTLCAALEVTPKAFDLRHFGNQVGALTPQRYHVPIPHRNFLAIAAAAGIAQAWGAEVLCLGITAADAEEDPCARDPFLTAIRAALASLSMILHTPFCHLSKAEVIGQGRNLGVPWQKTYSCLLGRARHCGICPQCQKRRAAFAQAASMDMDVHYAAGKQ